MREGDDREFISPVSRHTSTAIVNASALLAIISAGLSLPGGIVMAIAPTVPFAELLNYSNNRMKKRTMRIYEDHRIGEAACRVPTTTREPYACPTHIPRNFAAVDRLQ